MPMRRLSPRSYDEYLKAYSVAMLPGRERTNVSYGGKSTCHSALAWFLAQHFCSIYFLVIMPPSALANLTNLDLQSPWMFQLRNPSNPAASTHAGVLEFIAEEGVVHLPYWMMKTLRLNEGDPIRITGTELPKGKLVKLQAQSVHFLEISDHRAVYAIIVRSSASLSVDALVPQIGASSPQFLGPDSRRHHRNFLQLYHIRFTCDGNQARWGGYQCSRYRSRGGLRSPCGLR